MKKIIFTLILTSLSITLTAQDIIIKTDHTEITAKVIEVGETSIKYKFWDRQEGPTYILKKVDIFLIVYKSGVKEHYGKAELTSNNSSSSNNHITPSTPTSNYQEPSNTSNIVAVSKTASDTAKKEEPEERPSYPSLGRINVGFGKTPVEGVSTWGIGGYATLPFLKNRIHSPEFELGSYSVFSNIDNELFESKSNTYFVSGALNYGVYVIKSLKISGGVGYFYGWGETTVSSQVGDSTSNISVSDLFYSGSIDFFITKGFGLNLRYDEILGLNFGISFTN